MKKFLVLIFAMIIVFAIVVACDTSEEQITETTQEEPALITMDEVLEIMESDNPYVFLDVRTLEEREEGTIPNSVHIPYDEIQKANNALDKEVIIIVFCRAGRRSDIAARELLQMGFQKVYDLGALENWTGEIQ